MTFEKRALSPQALRILTGTAAGAVTGAAGGHYLTSDDENRTRNTVLGGIAGGVLGGLGGQGYHMYRGRAPHVAAGSPEPLRFGAGSPESPRFGAGSPEPPRVAAGSPESPRFGAGSPEPPRVAAGSPQISRGPGQSRSRKETSALRRQAHDVLEQAKRRGFNAEGLSEADVLSAAQHLQLSESGRRVLKNYPFALRMVKGAEFLDIEDQARIAVLNHFGLSKTAAIFATLAHGYAAR